MPDVSSKDYFMPSGLHEQKECAIQRDAEHTMFTLFLFLG